MAACLYCCWSGILPGETAAEHIIGHCFLACSTHHLVVVFTTAKSMLQHSNAVFGKCV